MYSHFSLVRSQIRMYVQLSSDPQSTVSHGGTIYLVPHTQHAHARFSLQSTSSALSYLEKRQEWVLSHITRLQERVKDFANEMGVGAADVGILQQVNNPYGIMSTRGGTHFDHTHPLYLERVISGMHLLLPPNVSSHVLLARLVRFMSLSSHAS